MKGRSVTYNPLGVSGSAITAIVEPIRVVPTPKDDGIDNVKTRNVTASVADVPSPDERDTFTIDAATWYVKEIDEQTETIVTFECTQIAPIEKTRGGLRR